MTSDQASLPALGRPARRSVAARVGTTLGLTAAALAGLAVANGYAARLAERRNPPKGRFLTMSGVRLHYLEAGRGPAVVLVHGNLATADDFLVSGLFDRLARHHRVIAIDRPGMGHSERPRGRPWTPAEQAALLRRAFAGLGIVKPIVLGHSFGATVAMAMALDHPQALGGLVLLSGYYFPTKRLDVLLTASQAVPVLGDVLRHTLSPPIGAAIMPLLFKAIFAPMPVPDHFAALFPTALAVRPGQIRASAQDAATMIPAARAMQDRYRELAMPIAILSGDQDRIVDPTHQSLRLHQDIPNSILYQIRGAGHMVHYADTALVADTVGRVAAMSSAPAGAPA